MSTGKAPSLLSIEELTCEIEFLKIEKKLSFYKLFLLVIFFYKNIN